MVPFSKGRRVNNPSEMPDFDLLLSVFRIDHMSDEARRHALLQQCIDEAAPAQRPALARLIARIDEARSSELPPIPAAIASTRRMLEQAAALNGELAHLAEETAAWQMHALLKKLRVRG